jgi:hypothetical protein
MSITHRLNTGGSVQALTILDDDYLIAGLQGGNILVGSRLSFLSLAPVANSPESIANIRATGMVAQHLPACSFHSSSQGRGGKLVHL